MGRFADPYGDDNRLPEGMQLTGYDADTGRRHYVDTKDGSAWIGAPYAEYGILTPVKSRTARQDNAKYRRRVYDESSGQRPPARLVHGGRTRDGSILDGCDNASSITPPPGDSQQALDGRDPEEPEANDGRDASTTCVTSPSPITPTTSSASRYSQSSYPHDGQVTPTASARQGASPRRGTSVILITPTTSLSSGSMYSQSSYPHDGDATPTATVQRGGSFGRSQTLKVSKTWDTRASVGSSPRDGEGEREMGVEGEPHATRDGKEIPIPADDSKENTDDVVFVGTASTAAIAPLLSQDGPTSTTRRKHPALRQISRLIAWLL